MGKEFQINCTATNVPDASGNLTFTWTGPNGVELNFTNPDEDSSRTATSTLNISMITHHHGGVYQCIVRNGGAANDTITSEIVVQGMRYLINHIMSLNINHILVRPSRPREFNMIYQDINSLTLRWNDPAHTHGAIDHFNVNMLTL